MIKKNNPVLIKIVKMLNDHEYHDGDTLGQTLKITRSAVWKIIKKLQNYAVKIDSIKGKGYKLIEPLMLLDAAEIQKKVKFEKLDISIFESIDSTNEYLKTLKGIHNLKFCLAEQQTKGRGRLNRKWYSPFGQNIYLSCFYSFQKDVSELAGLSLAISLAIIKTLRSYCLPENIFVKWPNDIIYIDNKINNKLSGCLIDIYAETHGTSCAVIGIGINVNMLDDEREINQPWTSMQKILGHYVDRNELSASLINNLLDYLTRFNAQGFSSFIDEWMEADYLANQLITLKNINKKVTGKVTGVNAQGHLLLKLASGEICAFSSGDTSVVQ